MEVLSFLSDRHIMIFLVQIFLLLVVAKLFGIIFLRWGWPALLGELLCGLILGPTLLGRVLPEFHARLFPNDVIQKTMLETIAWFGVLLLLLVTGFQVRLSTVWKEGKSALTIGAVGVVVPLLMGCAAFCWLPAHYWGPTADRLVFTLVLSTIAAISAIPVIAKVLYDLDILRSDLGLSTLSAFVVNEILGWILFTAVLGISAAETEADIRHPLRIFIEIVLFGAVCLTLGTRLVGNLTKWIQKTRIPQTAAILTLITCLALACGVIVQWIGLHAILGFFLAGIMAGNSSEISEHSREIISQMVHAIFVPLFFVSIGLQIDFAANFDLMVVLLFCGVSILGKFIGAWWGGRLVKMSSEDSISIGIAHIPGGAMEIIIGLLAFELRLISNTVFVAILFGASFSSVLVGPMLSWSIKRRKVIHISRYLCKKGIAMNLDACDRWEAIAELGRIAASFTRLDRDMIASAVRKREEVMGTGLGKAVAVPHARLPGTCSPVIVFGRSKSGIDWDARDGVRVRFIFLVLTPEQDSGLQVQTLAAIARLMALPHIASRIKEAKERDRLFRILRQGLKYKYKQQVESKFSEQQPRQN